MQQHMTTTNFTIFSYENFNLLRTFQQTPGAYPRPTPYEGIAPFIWGVWGCLGYAPGVCWVSLRNLHVLWTFPPQKKPPRKVCNLEKSEPLRTKKTGGPPRFLSSFSLKRGFVLSDLFRGENKWPPFGGGILGSLGRIWLGWIPNVGWNGFSWSDNKRWGIFLWIFRGKQRAFINFPQYTEEQQKRCVKTGEGIPREKCWARFFYFCVKNPFVPGSINSHDISILIGDKLINPLP